MKFVPNVRNQNQLQYDPIDSSRSGVESDALTCLGLSAARIFYGPNILGSQHQPSINIVYPRIPIAAVRSKHSFLYIRSFAPSVRMATRWRFEVTIGCIDLLDLGWKPVKGTFSINFDHVAIVIIPLSRKFSRPFPRLSAG